MTTVYADSDALAAWTGADAPANATQLLRSASLLVTDATARDVYDVDDQGVPTDAEKAQAMSDAACAQAALWAVNGIDPSAGVAGTGARVVQSSELGSGKVAYDSTVQAQARATAVDELFSEAVSILRQAGLASTSPLAL